MSCAAPFDPTPIMILWELCEVPAKEHTSECAALVWLGTKHMSYMQQEPALRAQVLLPSALNTKDERGPSATLTSTLVQQMTYTMATEPGGGA